eukprot:scaffold129431_cov17-Tisochrysis_lutea.AAC.1
MQPNGVLDLTAILGVWGFLLLFPRLLRVREDKSPEDATSAHQTREAGILLTLERGELWDHVAEMYRMQAVVSKERKGGEDQEEEE